MACFHTIFTKFTQRMKLLKTKSSIAISVLILAGLICSGFLYLTDESTPSPSAEESSPVNTQPSSTVPYVPTEKLSQWRVGDNAVSGAYVGPAVPKQAKAFEDWRASKLGLVVDFLPDEDWSKIESPEWLLDIWVPAGRQLVLSVPMLPKTSSTLSEGDQGNYDQHFVKLSKALVARNASNSVIRLGWEFNGDWYRWSAKNKDPELFAEYWRRVVTAMRSVPGAEKLKFDWTIAANVTGVKVESAYPGDDYVDFIGMDVYDQGWGKDWKNAESRWNSLSSGEYGLSWHAKFAAEHGKPMTYPEWGVAERPDGHGGGDSPSFISHMKDWIASNNVAYEAYFDFDAPDGGHRLDGETRFPQSACRYLHLFSSEPSSAGAAARC